MLTSDFLRNLKDTTEARWREKSIDPTIYGFQIQRGTRWNPGLPDEKIAEYERTLHVRFPDDMKAFLRELNGTDLPTLNVYGGSGEPHRESVGVYSYPRDLEIIRERIEHIRPSRAEIASDLASQGFELPAGADLVPIFSHRYVVCSPDPEISVVLSIVVKATDAIVYGKSLRHYLEKEFLADPI